MLYLSTPTPTLCTLTGALVDVRRPLLAPLRCALWSSAWGAGRAATQKCQRPWRGESPVKFFFFLGGVGGVSNRRTCTCVRVKAYDKRHKATLWRWRRSWRREYMQADTYLDNLLTHTHMQSRSRAISKPIWQCILLLIWILSSSHSIPHLRRALVADNCPCFGGTCASLRTLKEQRKFIRVKNTKIARTFKMKQWDKKAVGKPTISSGDYWRTFRALWVR